MKKVQFLGQNKCSTNIVDLLDEDCNIVRRNVSVRSRSVTECLPGFYRILTGPAPCGFKQVTMLSDWAYLDKEYRAVCLFQHIFEK